MKRLMPCVLAALVLVGGVLADAASAGEIKVRIKKPGSKTPAGETAEFKIKLENRERSERTVTLEVSLDDAFDTAVAHQTITLAAREKRKIVVSFEVPERYTEKKISVWARAGDDADDCRFKVRRADESAITPSDRDAGQELFLASCAACHGDTGADLRGEDFGDWKEAVREGEDDMPAMPGFTDDDIRLMRAYVQNAGSGGDPSATDQDWLDGKAMYLASCSGCHGTRGNDIRNDDLGDWREAVREGEDDMPAFPGFSSDDVRKMREYVLEPDRVVEDPDPDPNPDPDPAPPTYDGAVKAILTASCTSCHNASFAFKNFVVDTYATAYANRVALVASVENDSMPTAGPLSSANKTTLRDWLDAGAPEN